MFDLYPFSEKIKRKRFQEISNAQARNLVAQMLTKDTKLRPSMSQVLVHPFLSGGNVARLIGEEASFDVFSVQSDLNHAKKVSDILTAAELKVWWDKVSLKPGVPWQVSV